LRLTKRSGGADKQYGHYILWWFGSAIHSDPYAYGTGRREALSREIGPPQSGRL